MSPSETAGRPLDAITLDIVEAAVTAAADEMFAVLKKTAMSPIIYEVLDAGTAITDADGNLASSGAGIPTFVGALDKAVRQLLARVPRARIAPGDAFVANDPYFGGVSHLNDVIVMMPVFHGDRLMAWCAVMAHWNDVGGKVPGSMAADAATVHEEGLRLPPVHLARRGTVVRSVLDILLANSRLPDFVEGDLWASVAAVRRGAAVLEQLMARFGPDAFAAALARSFDLAERRARQGLAGFGAGHVTVSARQDDGTDWSAAIDVTRDAFTVDLRAAPDQSAGPMNLSRDGAEIAAQLAFKIAVDPVKACNAGSFRPLTVLTRPGSLFDPAPPAAHGFYFETRIRLVDLLLKGIAALRPDRSAAGHFASICSTVLSNRHPDTGRKVTLVEPQQGGWGATADGDGQTALFSQVHGDTFNCPVEITEARYGIDVDCRALHDEAAGIGRHRGGPGLRMRYRIRADSADLAVGFSHTSQPPWGLAGGAPGGLNGVTILRRDGRREPLAVASGIALAAGDVVEVRTAHGAGWGIEI